MARPKLQQERRKGRIVSFRLTDADFAKLEEAAVRANLRLTDLARSLALSGGNRVVVKTFTACDPAYLARINQIGNNLNQLARRANATGEIPPGLTELCALIEAIVTEAVSEEWKS